MKRFIASCLGAVSLAPLVVWPACTAQSGPETAALVELYTSEGCSSCPPADRQLSQLPNANFSASKVIPISLHVNYWDYIGWKDPFAKPAFSERQVWLVHANHRRTSYTPHFFVSGMEVGNWRGDLFDKIRRINTQPARASIQLRVAPGKAGIWGLDADASSTVTADPLALYLAITEDRLVSRIQAGENGGATLHHDHVVREWIGPIPLVAGKAVAHRDVSLPAYWNQRELKVVGLVQNSSTGEVLQAVSTERCSAG
ncbi:MAG: DUF1223 domain-containing protein [Pseudomonadota bacterium]